ncbi:MAG: protein kinase [Phycisphaera sp.]|nr:protein kinase [Phycisphaera sp.]
MGFKARRISEMTCPECGGDSDVSRHRPFDDHVCPHCRCALKVPAGFAHYQVYERLGKGAYGFVFRAMDTRLRRQVAIKVLVGGDGGAGNAEVNRELLKEARTLATMNHPHIVNVHTLGEHDGQPFVEMELLSGGSAKQIYKSKTRPTERRVLDLGVAMAGALEAARQVGLIHMDVKPGNILFDHAGVAKLIDFGAAWHQRGANGEQRVVGTSFYIAPEAAGGRPPDFRSDMYSLGATLFHLLAGRPPFEEESSMETIRARLRRAAPSVQAFRGDVSDATADVLTNMLATDPADRYASYDDLIEALHAAASA